MLLVAEASTLKCGVGIQTAVSCALSMCFFGGVSTRGGNLALSATCGSNVTSKAGMMACAAGLCSSGTGQFLWNGAKATANYANVGADAQLYAAALAIAVGGVIGATNASLFNITLTAEWRSNLSTRGSFTSVCVGIATMSTNSIHLDGVTLAIANGTTLNAMGANAVASLGIGVRSNARGG